ncbi:MAG: hypothetical protein ACP5SI_05210 [Chloroflexia bacterium]
MRRSIGRLGLAFAALAILAGCGPSTVAPAATPQPTPAVQEKPAELLRRLIADPGVFLGQKVTVEGILEAEGKGRDVRFFLRAAGGGRLEVTPWAPLEVVRPPEGGKQPKSMPEFVGRHLRLTGTVVKGGSGWILQVESCEEL